MQLQPREYFTIVRQLPDPNDSNTYYVRAVVRDARTDTLIENVNLTDRGSRRFSLPWQTPADVSGLGFYISVCTTVYTDSGYTLKSDTYAEEMQTYLVQNRFQLGGGGSGGADVDYTKLKRIFKETLEEVFFNKDGEFKFLPDFSTLIKALDSLGLSRLSTWMNNMGEKVGVFDVKIDRVQKSINDLEIPKATDLVPVLQAIADKEVTEKADDVDLSPILAALTSLQKSFDTETLQEITKKLPALSQSASELEVAIKEVVLLAYKVKEDLQKPPEKLEKPDYAKQANKILNTNVPK